MCGIVGYAGKNKAISKIMTGLKSLEYRGYDSAGIAYIKEGNVKIEKEVGPIDNLINKLNYDEDTNLGISHTRWATHGGVNKANSHPHQSGKITLVHNGIIENYEELKNKYLSDYKFISDTDTEVLASFIDKLYSENKDMVKVLNSLSDTVRGSYALNIINTDYPDTIFGVRRDSPLVVGIGENENMLASDIPALLHVTSDYVVIDNYDVVVLTSSDVKFYDKNGNKIEKEVKHFSGSLEEIDKKGYSHYMLKEINEEAEVVKKLLSIYTDGDKITIPFDLNEYKEIDIVACGSAAFSGEIGKYYIEKYLNIKVNVTFASEWRYQKNFFSPDKLVIVISQSGETADTLAALKLAHEANTKVLAIVNRRDSSIAREADYVIYIEAGIEIAVATTKAYLAQALVLLLLATKNTSHEKEVIDSLKLLPNLIIKYINDVDYSYLAKQLYKKSNVFYLGRGIDFALCMEGSLKLKEISYIHSEAFQAGELKHGSISLIDKDFGVVTVVTDKTICEKTISNIKEVKARGAEVIAITNIKNDNFSDYKIEVDDINDIINPILVIVPMQLLAYNTALMKNLNIDKPRNLAKSVTVE